MGRFVFKLPDVGEGTVEAEIVTWHVNVGDRVSEDQNLVDVMTDKATVEMTSPVTGRVTARHGEPGDMAAVGAPLVELETESAAAPVPETSPPPPQNAEPPPQDPKSQEPEQAPRPVEANPIAPEKHPPASSNVALASPAVRQRAQRLGLDLHSVKGTGEEGRITHADLDARLTTGAALQTSRDGVEEIKIIGLRRKIAEKMQEAKRHIPHFSYVEEIDMTDLEALRSHLNQQREAGQPKLSILPFILRALVRILPEYPQINAHFDDAAGIVHRHAALHAGIATQTESGLMVPVIHHVERYDVWELAGEIARVATAARDGKAAREELSGSTLTITSLGVLGGVATTPVINRPEVAIIGPNAILERPVIRDGQIAIRKMMNLSSSFDHRVVDGYDAAAFVQRLKTLLEYPATIFMA